VLKDLRTEQRVLFWALIAITLATRLFVATADFRNLIDLDIYQDDAFYYMKIARNLLDGRGMTFDGTNPSNGFHPLYMFFLLPLMKLGGENLEAPIRLSALALTAVSVVTGFLLFRVSRFIAGRGVAFAALALFSISPYFVAFGINGQETGLAYLFGLLVVDQYLRGFRPPAQPSPKFAAWFGFLCGMAILARSDLLLLLIALAIDRIALLIRDSRRASYQTIGVAFLTACATWLVWGGVSYSHTGSWLPQSGDALREVSRNYGWANLPAIWHDPEAEPLFDPQHPPAEFHADVAARLGFVFLFEHPLLAPLRAHVPFSVWPALGRYAPYNAYRSGPAAGTAVLGAFALSVVLLSLRHRRRHAEEGTQAGNGFGRILLVYLALIGVGYVFYAPAHWYFSRYLGLPILLSLVYGLAKGSEALRSIPLPQTKLAFVITAVLIASQIISMPREKIQRLHADVTRAGGFLGNWHSIGRAIPEDKKLGSFQAGIYSYFGERDVFNLDGVVNPAALAALKEKRLHEYVLDEGSEYILDWAWILNTLLIRHAPAGSLSLRALARTSTRPFAVLFTIAANEENEREQ